MSADQFEISIIDSAKRSATFSSYVSYQISLNTSSPRFSSSVMTFNRRYSDFVWLAEVFCTMWPFVILPPLPPKQIVGNLDDRNVEYRKRCLERFLKRVVANELLVTSSQFQVFCRDGESDFEEGKKALELKSTATYFGHMKTWFKSDAVANAKPSKLAVNPNRLLTFKSANLDFNFNEELVDPTEKSTEIVSSDDSSDILRLADTKLIKTEYQNFVRFYQKVLVYDKSVVKRLMDLSGILQKLHECEGDQGDGLAEALQQTSPMLESLATQTSDFSMRQNFDLVEGFEEYIEYFQSLENALLRRQDKMIAFEDSYKIFHADKKPMFSSLPTMAELESQRAECQFIYDGLKIELKRFEQHRITDVWNMFQTHIDAQVSFHGALKDTLQGALPVLEVTSLGSNMISSLTAGDSSQHFEIQVSNVSKQMLYGLKFQVVTLTSKPGYAGGEIGVYRSTADVEWLLRTLAVVCPHIVIPELKFDVSAITAQYHASTNSGAEAAMEAKRRVLEELFRRISLQELLCQQQCYTQFLVADDEAFRDAKAQKPISLIAQQIMERSTQNSGQTSSESSPRPVAPGTKKAPPKPVAQDEEYQYASNDDLEFETNPFGAVDDYETEESIAAATTERPRRRTILDEAPPEEEDYLSDLTRFISVSGLEETQADGEAKEFYSYLGKAMIPTRALLNLCVTVLAGAIQAKQNLDKYVQALDGVAKTEVLGLPAALSVLSNCIPAQKDIWANFLEQYIHSFLEPLFAEAHLIAAARYAIKRYIRKRQQHNSTYRDMMAAKEAVTKEQAVLAAAGNEPSSGAPRSKKEETLERAQFRYRIVKEEFEDFAAKLITECDNFKTQRSYALRQLLHKYMSLEVLLAESLQGAWTDALNAFTQCPLEQGTVPAHAVSD